MAGRSRKAARWAVLVALAAALPLAAFSMLRVRPAEERDVEYARVGGRPLRLDIYRPRTLKSSSPGVFLIHGGGWFEGDKSGERSMAEGLARAGYVAIAVEYRLARDGINRHPAQVDDVRRAVRWVRANAAYVGVDPARLGAFGLSAGGHLAAILGTTDVTDDSDPALKGISSRVACVVDLCGPTDFTDDASPPVTPAIAWCIPNLFGKARVEAPEAYRDASPLAHVDARSAPTLIFHGTEDELVPLDQSRRFRDALSRAAVEVKLIEVEGETHVFQTPAARDLMLRETMSFLRRHLRP